MSTEQTLCLLRFRHSVLCCFRVRRHRLDVVFFCLCAEKYFDMQKKQCREALEIYKRFLARMERCAEFLKVAEVCHVNSFDNSFCVTVSMHGILYGNGITVCMHIYTLHT